MTEKEKISNSFKKYLPEIYIPYVVNLLYSEKVSFRISKPRKSKLGDYRPPQKGIKFHKISVNGDLNPYSFLITTIHEFAHMKTYIKYGSKVKSHGVEWKNEFRKLLMPIIEIGELPKDIENALLQSLNNLKASSCTDLNLYRALKNYDEENKHLVPLEEIGNYTYFRIGDKILQRGVLRRTRYLCKEVKTGKQYLVSRIADVEVLDKGF